MVRLTRELSVNRDFIASVHWERSYCTSLVVTMQDGTQHSIKHTDGYTGGDDCYKIERMLLDA
ncbi:hypothetical protein BTE77_06555 [Ensifer adhaerens]|nr:hypothetical protein BTE77_06555 [Ensifer adhaerens]